MRSQVIARRRWTATPQLAELENRCVPTVVFQQLFNIPSGLPTGWTTNTTLGSPPGTSTVWQVDATTGTSPATDPTPPTGITAGNSVAIDDPAGLTDKVLVSPAINIPNVTGTQLRFRHNWDLESGFDGGVLEIAIPGVAGGAFQDIETAGGSFASGGYTGTISTFFGSAIAGRSAWTSTSSGWVTSLVTLPAAAIGVSGVQFRWRMASDDSVAATGWRIDSVQMATPTTTFTIVSGNNQSAYLNQGYANKLQVLVLDGFGAPAAGRTVTYTAPATGASVTFDGGTNTVGTLSDGTAWVFVTANNTAGTFTVTAATAGAANRTFTLTNKVNFPPVVSAGGPYTAITGDTVVFTATATDPENDPLTYTWDLNGDGVFGDALGRQVTLTALQLKSLGVDLGFSTANLRVRVADGFNTVTSAAAGLTINPVPVPPPPSPPPGTVITGRTVTPLFATAAGPGAAPHVRVFNADGSQRFSFFAYDLVFTGGISVATGDVNGDGLADIVTGAGPNGGPHVKVYDGKTGAEFRSFFAFDPVFRNGITVAVADIDNDGYADVIVGAGPKGGPHVKVFSGRDGSEVRSFFAFDRGFTGGVSVAGGDLNGDGRAEIIVGAGAGGGPNVKAFDGVTGAVVRDFFAFSPGFGGGVTVAAGDLNADGKTDLLVGMASGGSTVSVIDGATGATTVSTDAFPGSTSGVRVAINDLTGDGRGDAIVGTGVGTASLIRILKSDGTALRQFDPFSGFTGGVFVG